MASAILPVPLQVAFAAIESSTSYRQLDGATATRVPSFPIQAGRSSRRRSRSLKSLLAVSCCSTAREPEGSASDESRGPQRRALLFATAATALAGAAGCPPPAEAVSNRRATKDKAVPESEFTELPSGLKVYDVSVGSGPPAVKGSRVAVHYVAKWKGLTFMTSRQGLGVTGGTPYGFDVGSSELGYVLKGLDQGVEGMRVGGERLLIVPPQLAYGNRGVQEIPPNATLEFNVELLSIKQDAFGSRVKLVEG